MSFPARLKALLEDRKISMRELGRRIGTSHVTVGKWLSGIQMPSDENLEALAEYFHVTPAFLRFGDTSLSRPQTLEPNADVVSIPVLDVRGSCGYGGELAQTIQLVQMLRVTKQWLLSKSTSFLNFQTLHIITADGDSMEPGIKRGDFVIVDTSQSRFIADGLYAVQYSNAVFIKRVQIHPGGKVELISDNPKYRPIQLDTCESVEVIGRAVLCFNVREL